MNINSRDREIYNLTKYSENESLRLIKEFFSAILCGLGPSIDGLE